MGRLTLLLLLLTGCVKEVWVEESISLMGATLSRLSLEIQDGLSLEILGLDEPLAYLNLAHGHISREKTLIELRIGDEVYSLEAEVHKGGQRLSLPAEFFLLLKKASPTETLSLSLSGRKTSFQVKQIVETIEKGNPL